MVRLAGLVVTATLLPEPAGISLADLDPGRLRDQRVFSAARAR